MFMDVLAFLFPEVKAEFEQKIAELIRTGNSKAASGKWSYEAASS